MSTIPNFIDQNRDLVRLVEHLRQFEAIALDAEMDSYYSYFPKLCLIQVSTDEDDYLIDPLAGLDLSPLQTLFSSTQQLKVLHAAENDIPYFKEHVGGDFVALFDTHIAAKILGLSRAGLAPLLEEYLQVTLDKRFQTADWRIRPLPPDQSEYAMTDTRHLLELWRIFEAQLQEKGLVDLATFSFEEACQSTPGQRVFNPEGWRKIQGSNKLHPAQKAMLRDLYEWREQLAQDLDMAVFRVLPDGILLGLTHHSRATPQELRAHFSHRTVQQDAPEIARILQEAPTRPLAPPARQPQEGRLSPAEEKLFTHLRDWRNAHPSAPLTNKHLKRLVDAAPSNWTAFSELKIMAPSLLESLGKELWEEYEQNQPKRQSGKR